MIDCVIGNGSMLVYGEGPNISEMYAKGYTSPSFLAVNAELGELYAYHDLSRKPHTSTYIRRIFSNVFHKLSEGERITRTIEDIRMADIMDPCDDIFVRYCESMRPFELKLSVAPYVRKSLLRGYRIGRKSCDILCLVIPKGVSFYKNEATAAETKMLVILDGDAKFNSDGDRIDVFPGSSRIMFVAGDGDGCLKNAVKAIDDGYYFEDNSLIAQEGETFWTKVLSRTSSGISEDALRLLISLQSREGGVIASHGNPTVRTDGVKDIVRAFLKLGLFDRARNVLEFFCKRFDKDKTFYQVYGTFEGQNERYFSDVSIGGARLISAMLDYAEYTGDVGFIKENFTMLKSAMYAQMKELSRGMMPFSGIESEFSDEILGVGTQFHGSLEASVESASAILRLTEFCYKNSLKLPHDNGSAARRGKEMLQSIEKYFIYRDRVSLNAPERELSIKKPRFVFGDCDICRHSLSYVCYGELERGQNGIYMCPKCYRDNFDVEISTRDEKCFLPQAAAILLSEKIMREYLGEDKVRRLLSAALEERCQNMLVRTAGADSLFLLLARKYGMKEYAEVLEKAIEKDILEKRYPRTVCGNYTKGVFDTKTAAGVLCAFE